MDISCTLQELSILKLFRLKYFCFPVAGVLLLSNSPVAKSLFWESTEQCCLFSLRRLKYTNFPAESTSLAYTECLV